MDILTPDQIKPLIAEHGRTARRNWALRKGGSIDIVLLGNGSFVAVHPEPKKLTKDEIAEIEKIIAAETSRAAATARRDADLAAEAAEKAARAEKKAAAKAAKSAPGALSEKEAPTTDTK